MDIHFLAVLSFLQVWVDDLVFFKIQSYHYLNILCLSHIANDQLDANTAEDFELRTIRGLGENIVDKICKEREKSLFEDENDLYNKVTNIPKEARKLIKVTKKISGNYNRNRTNS